MLGICALLAGLTSQATRAEDAIDPEALAPDPKSQQMSPAAPAGRAASPEAPRIGAMLGQSPWAVSRSPVAPPLPPGIGKPRTRRISRTFPPPGPGQTAVFAQIKGPAVIRHMWFTWEPCVRGQVLRVYWDDEKTPSIEMPLIDFFGGGININTPVMTVVPNLSYNSYFPMPFRKSARLELYNASTGPVSQNTQFAQIDYELLEESELPAGTPYFHAQWNRINPAPDMYKQVPVCRAEGAGAYVGMTLQVHPSPDAGDAWYHGGGDLQVVDGAGTAPDVIAGIGGEDYFGGAWGSPEFETPLTGIRNRKQQDGTTWIYAYRFHLPSPIQFSKSFLSMFGSVKGDYTLVSYWYQAEPHRDFLKPIDAAAIAPSANLPLGSRLLPARPQETIEWLYGDGSKKAFSDYYALNLNRYRWKGFRHWHAAEETLRTTFHCPDERKAYVNLGFDDDLVLTLNGEKVFEGSHRPDFGAKVVEVSLKKGENAVELRTTNRDGTSNWWAWTFTFRIADKAGKTMQDLEFVTYPDIPEGRP